eukprot:GILJ01016002.1.p1 GENE.GILJ01016002.1~~GILJ01016002.1.p1  ORF type:complete len:102 (-),score=10.66 GILJ01016002.1:106-411(-)
MKTICHASSNCNIMSFNNQSNRTQCNPEVKSWGVMDKSAEAALHKESLGHEIKPRTDNANQMWQDIDNQSMSRNPEQHLEQGPQQRNREAGVDAKDITRCS